jgi:putative ABC transport system permease protein
VGRIGGLLTALRALRSRAATTALIFVVAVVAVAGGTAGPTYYRAGQTSILRDTVASASVQGRGLELTQAGQLFQSFGSLEARVDKLLGPAGPLFSSPVEARQATAYYPASGESLLLAAPTDICSRLEFQGRCPSAPNEITISRSLAVANHWTIGQVIQMALWGRMTITAIYQPPAASSDYWFDQFSTYFPFEFGDESSHSRGAPSHYDTLFTAMGTFQNAPGDAEQTLVISRTLDVDRLGPPDRAMLAGRVNTLLEDPGLNAVQAVVVSDIPATMIHVESGWTSLAVPVAVITLELLALAALLLWVLVTDAAAARGPEIALAKLRGYGRARLAGFALSELVLLVAGAVPVGVVLGWSATAAMGSGLLRPGTQVTLSALGWAAGAAAAAGGLFAAVAGIRPTLKRSVMEQWRRSNRRPGRSGWTFDAIAVTGAVAGLVEVEATGSISAAHQHPLALLVPGLVGLAVGVVAARLLPSACRVAARNIRRDSPAIFLALRQVSRRPGAMRTTTVLAAAFALASFSLAAWSLAQSNYVTASRAEVGASTVLDVGIPLGSDLSTLVSRADPTGRYATPVAQYYDNGVSTVAVIPSQWERIGLAVPGGPSATDLSALDPSEPAPLVLDGDTVVLHIAVAGTDPAGLSLSVAVVSLVSGTPVPVQLSGLSSGNRGDVTGALPACPCRVAYLTAQPTSAPATDGPPGPATVTVAGLDVRQGDRSVAVPASSLGAADWYDSEQSGRVAPAAGGGFSWTFSAGPNPSTLDYRDHPFPLPAIASGALAGKGPYAGTGLDGSALAMKVVNTARTVPGAPGSGVLVDLDYAERAAGNAVDPTLDQVWLAGNAPAIESRLRDEGVSIQTVSTVEGVATGLRRSGPGLAGTLFLSESAVAAALAAGAAIAGIYLLARRRRYEFAALLTTGVARRTLVTSVLVEQVVLISYAAIVGIGAGLGSSAILLRDVPEFTVPTTGLVTAAFPPAFPMVPVIVAGLAIVLAVAALAAVRLVGGTETAQLREAPS